MTSVTTDISATTTRNGHPSRAATAKRILLPAIESCQGSIFNTLKQREEAGERVGRRNARGACVRRIDQLKCGLGYFFGAR